MRKTTRPNTATAARKPEESVKSAMIAATAPQHHRADPGGYSPSNQSVSNENITEK